MSTVSTEFADRLVATEFKTVDDYRPFYKELDIPWPKWIESTHPEDVLWMLANEFDLPKGYDTYGDSFKKLNWVGNDRIREKYFIQPTNGWWAELNSDTQRVLLIDVVVETDDCYDWELNEDRYPCRTWAIDPEAKSISLTMQEFKLLMEMS